MLAADLTGCHYDRRGRGDSGDTPPYAVQRELEDLEALTEEAGGAIFVCTGVRPAATSRWQQRQAAIQSGSWRCGSRALLVDDTRPPLPDDCVAQLEERVATSRRDDAVEYFLTTAVGLPSEVVAQMRGAPTWAGMEQVAHTLAYDGRIVDGFRLRTDRLGVVSTPALVMDCGQTPWMTSGAQALAQASPSATHRSLDGQGDGVAPGVIAPVLVEFFAA
jgi:hypothetical protein